MTPTARTQSTPQHAFQAVLLFGRLQQLVSKKWNLSLGLKEVFGRACWRVPLKKVTLSLFLYTWLASSG